jgi:hypothetical protein
MSFFHSPNIVTNGLVLAFDAANPKSYPGSGTTWYDISGGNRNGTLVNGVGYSSNYKGILIFDGADDRVEVSNSGLLPNGTGNFSYNVWVNLQGKPSVGTIFENGYYYAGILIRYETDGITIYAGGGFAYWGKFSFNPPLGQWNHLGFVRNGSSLDFYVNGVYQASMSFTANITYDPNLFIGTSQHATSQCFNGYIANTQIYNRALTASEVLQNYNATRQRFVYAYSEGNNAAPYVGNWNNTTTYTMNQFGGLGKVNAHGFSSGPVTYTLTLSSLPVHTEVRYKVFWHLVDSLDNETNQLFTMNSSGGETEKLRFTKQYNLEPAISVQDSGVIAPWSGHQTYTYRPWAGGAYGQDGYLSIDTGWYSHTANSFTARHVMGADQGQTDEAEYLSHVQVYLR